MLRFFLFLISTLIKTRAVDRVVGWCWWSGSGMVSDMVAFTGYKTAETGTEYTPSAICR